VVRQSNSYSNCPNEPQEVANLGHVATAATGDKITVEVKATSTTTGIMYVFFTRTSSSAGKRDVPF
jgi:hypothetical protein